MLRTDFCFAFAHDMPQAVAQWLHRFKCELNYEKVISKMSYCQRRVKLIDMHLFVTISVCYRLSPDDGTVAIVVDAVDYYFARSSVCHLNSASRKLTSLSLYFEKRQKITNCSSEILNVFFHQQFCRPNGSAEEMAKTCQLKN